MINEKCEGKNSTKIGIQNISFWRKAEKTKEASVRNAKNKMWQGIGKAKTDDKINDLARQHNFLFCQRKKKCKDTKLM